MGGNGRKPDNYAITPRPSIEPRHSTLDAALEAARPALVRLYSGFQHRRQAEIAEFVASFLSAHGCPPTAADVAAGLEPRISKPAVAWYLSRSNSRDRGDDLLHSISDSSKSRNGGAHESKCCTQVAGEAPAR